MAYSSIVKPVKPTKAMRKMLTKKRDHDYLTATADIFHVLNYEGTLIMASFGILSFEDKCTPEEGSYRPAVYWFIGAIAAQLVMGILNTIIRQESAQKEWINRICMIIVVCISIYLLGYFFIY